MCVDVSAGFVNRALAALPPSAHKVNLCTATGPVLDAFFALARTGNQNNVQYSLIPPDQLAKSRASGCFPTLQSYAPNEPDIAKRVGTTSAFFQLRTWVRIGSARFALYSLMYRDGSAGVRPILRTFGTE